MTFGSSHTQFDTNIHGFEFTPDRLQNRFTDDNKSYQFIFAQSTGGRLIKANASPSFSTTTRRAREEMLRLLKLMLH
jgi:hypothetical protein